MDDLNITLSEKLQALKSVVSFKPSFTIGIIFFGSAVAVFEGIGISFIIPIVEIAQSNGEVGTSNRFAETFVEVFSFLGIPFVMEYVILVGAVIITLRYTGSFLVSWLREILKAKYIAHLRRSAFKNVLAADVEYFDQQGTDDVLNSTITQTKYAGDVVHQLVRISEEIFIGAAYFLVALYLSIPLTLGTAVILGILILLIRQAITPGYSSGEQLASANERLQTSVQTAIQGIRDVKLFHLENELYDDFQSALRRYVSSTITISRNGALLTQGQNLATTLVVFLLIYVALQFTNLQLSELGVFLFAMFRLAPRLSTINNKIYGINSSLPHVVRTNEFVSEAGSHRETDANDQPAPDTVRNIKMDSVTFAYEPDDPVLNDVSFSIERGDFVAFVGPSGAGKSTIVSLLGRFYSPDTGSVRANGTSIDEFDLDSWRSKLAVVRQHPVIFNDTLRFNLTIGNREATEPEIEHACELAQVNEFLAELPDGLDTVLGENGVRLSGGQRQRVALARALITDAELLVLDEATSNLDTNIEADVQSGIEMLEREYTVITIAHRLSTVKNADRIYTLEDGEIVETGTHQELIANDGTYADLYTAQSQQV